MERSVQENHSSSAMHISFEADEETQNPTKGSTVVHEDDLEAIWEQMSMLPPSSPSTVALLKSYGWTMVPPVAVHTPQDDSAEQSRQYENAFSTTSKKLYRHCFDSIMEKDSPCVETKGLAEDFLVPSNSDVDVPSVPPLYSHILAREDEEESVEVDDMNHLYAHFH